MLLTSKFDGSVQAFSGDGAQEAVGVPTGEQRDGELHGDRSAGVLSAGVRSAGVCDHCPAGVRSDGVWAGVLPAGVRLAGRVGVLFAEKAAQELPTEPRRLIGRLFAGEELGPLPFCMRLPLEPCRTVPGLGEPGRLRLGRCFARQEDAREEADEGTG